MEDEIRKAREKLNDEMAQKEVASHCSCLPETLSYLSKDATNGTKGIATRGKGCY